MRVACALRELRGDRTLRELEHATGISRGTLSRYERGRELPADAHVKPLERAYGPVRAWYPGHVYLELRPDS